MVKKARLLREAIVSSTYAEDKKSANFHVFTIFGPICFSPPNTEVYDKNGSSTQWPRRRAANNTRKTLPTEEEVPRSA